MATYQIIITSTLGTTQGTLTYSGADAGRIFNAWKAMASKPNATQQDMTTDLLAQAKQQFQDMCVNTETAKPVPPDITVS